MMGGRHVLGVRGAVPQPLAERFWEKVKHLDDDGEELPGCWEWIGSYNSKSFLPQINTLRADVEGVPKKMACRASTVSWVLSNGPVPKGAAPYRACANRRCVRPDHLRLRQFPGGRMPLFPWAVRRRVRKLTEAQAAEIRRVVESSRGRNGKADYGIYRRLGKKYGVARGTIGDVVDGRTWPNAMGDGKAKKA